MARQNASVAEVIAPRNILVAVAGGSPAIVTETLWALTKQKHVRVDEVRILTTAKGKAAILSTLLHATDGKFNSCVEQLELVHQITFTEMTVHVFNDGNGGELQDIRTDQDNTLAADQICGFIREWTQKPNIMLFCSVAGGRKTMSIYLTIAMMLYGRKDDRLFHVLVNPEEFELCKDFFHPYRVPRELTLTDRQGKVVKKISTADVTIDLAEVPFVKLGVLDTSAVFGVNQSYSAIVQTIQDRLDFLGRAASSHVKIGQAGFIRGRIPVEVAGRTCHLPPAQGFLYALFAEDRKKNGGGKEVDLISPRDLKRIYRRLTGAEYSAYLEDTQFKFLVQWLGYLAAKDESSLKKFRKAVTVSVSRANDALELALFPKQFLIQNLNEDKPRGKKSPGAMYTINLPGDEIYLPSL
ncbi:MAG: CRISPR-associated ring nuclease Csm6 [Pyrinomonadaceae bacterium]